MDVNLPRRPLDPPLDPSLFELDGSVWLSHCMDGPMPRLAVEKVQRVLEMEANPWAMGWESDFLAPQASLRRACAGLLETSTEDISLSPSTSAGILAVAHGLDWRRGDEVLLPQGEFPANLLPWISLAPRGVHCRTVPLWKGQQAEASVPPTWGSRPFEQGLLESLGPRTRLVAVSWVRFQDGLMLDLEPLGQECCRLGIPLVVDAIQGMGTFQPCMRGVSAMASGGHKGLLGPQGQGFLWTRSAFRERLLPRGTWLSMVEPFSQGGTQHAEAPAWEADGRRLEPGSPSIMGCSALLTSLEVLGGPGIPAIQAHVCALQARLLEALRPHPVWAKEAERLLTLRLHGCLGPILSFHHSAVGLERLRRHQQTGYAMGVVTTIREGYLRLAFHAWHGNNDLERTLAWMTSI